MKLIKYLSREYTLLEHNLIHLSICYKKTFVPEIKYSLILDVYRKGIMDIYCIKEEMDKNIKRVAIAIKKDKNYIIKKINRGIISARKLQNLPKELPSKIENLTNKQIIKELCSFKKRLMIFGGFLDLMHYIEKTDVKLNKKELKKFSSFHNYRKILLINYFKLLNKICSKIAKKEKLKSNNLNFLTFNEIIDFLKGKIKKSKVNKLQQERKNNFILIYKSRSKEKVISKNFNKEFKKIKKNIIKEGKISELKGIAINKGAIRGKVLHIKTRGDFSKIPKDKILVTHMTNPDMTPYLKRALAIVTDDGGILCHAASVAREFGVVAIIGTKIATKVLKDGQLVEVDANKGIVKIIKE